MWIHVELICVVSDNWETYILNEVADNSIVEIFNVCPLDAL